jgi:RNA polymerase sigma-70 factor, ECF subfamily
MTEDEFLLIYAEQMPRILGYCAFRLGSRHNAEDVTAETFARLLTRRGPSSAEKAPAWLFAVARNLCTDHERRAKRLAEMPERVDEPSEEPIWVDPALLDALGVLNPAQQQVFYLRTIEDMTFAQIGRALGRNETAIKMQYHRAVRRVRRELEEVESCSRTQAETT